MKITKVGSLAIADVKVVTFQRFADERGYFTETYRKSDFDLHPETRFLKGLDFTQSNESYSKKGVIRGLHFQWNPYMGKLVRVVAGQVIDLALDIRQNSPTFGKIIGHKLRTDTSEPLQEWLWIPVGFAHGLVFPEEGLIEYYCTGQWSPGNEAGISPLAPDLDWSLCDSQIKQEFDEVKSSNPLMSDKDRDGYTLESWSKSEDSKLFTYEKDQA